MDASGDPIRQLAAPRWQDKHALIVGETAHCLEQVVDRPRVIPVTGRTAAIGR